MQTFIIKTNSLLISFSFLLLLKLVLLQQTIDSNINNKLIFINQNIIIYIINNENENKIYYYDINSNVGNSLDTYSEIVKYKNIIKLDGEKFLIFGLNNFYQFCYRHYNYNNYKIFLNLEYCFNINNIYNLNKLNQLDVKFISGTKIILSTRIEYKFQIFIIDFQTHEIYFYQIQENDTNINVDSTYVSNNIQCDSNDGFNFFCIFCYNKISEWKLFFLSGKFDYSGIIISSKIKGGKICDKDCFLGNIIKINNFQNKYLICYQKKLGSLLSIACQYYSFIEDELIIENNNDVGRIVGESANKPLMLYIYDYSIFILIDTKSDNSISLSSILCSLDLKINIQTNLHIDSATTLISSINLFNTYNYIYIIYEENGQSTKIKNQPIKQCINDNSLTLSSFKPKIEIDFKAEHQSDIITFSLNSNINLYKDDNEIINSNSFISLSNSIEFNFGKKEETGVFENYYCYVNTEANGFYQYFSLICPLTITVCYSSCQTCVSGKIPTNENQLCLSCFNNYHAKFSEINNSGYNCYHSSDDRISNYYLNKGNNCYYQCHSSCKTCSKENSCDSCIDGYYFKSDNNNRIIDGLCYTSTIDYFYLDNSVNIQYSKQEIKTVYKPCYESCFSCKNSGIYENNNCLSCKTGMAYPFNVEQCTKDKQSCLSARNYWEVNRNNIECLETCETNIILYGNNRAQCVSNCKNYINPYSIITNYFTLNNCNGKNYCIPYEICLNGKFEVNLKEGKCERIGPCEIDVFNDIDPFEHDNDPIPTTIIETESENHMSTDEKIDDINRRIKIIKMFTNDYNYSSYESFDLKSIQDYIKLLKTESESHNNNEIYLITTTKYINFTITIYPIDIEIFAYEQIFSPNNLGFANFTKAFPSFIDYEINNNCIILIILMESHLTNSSINDINYYIYSFDEKKNDQGTSSNEINIEEENNLANNKTKLEILYPLYNYYNEKTNINERNTKNLVDNIKLMNYKYPNIELYNLKDPFYNDICSLFTSDVNTDMTLNDRRNEYYINISLCENNCYLIQILNKALKIPKSVCICNIKTNFSFNNQSGVKDNISLISSYNVKSIYCIKETFNKNSISSNIIFWIFLIAILFLIIMVIRWIFYGNKEINRIFRLYKKISYNNDLKISSIGNEGSEEIIKSKNNSINRNNSNRSKSHLEIKENSNINSKNDKKKGLTKSMALPDNNHKRYSNNQIESQQIEYLSAPINPSSPPKRREIKKVSTELNEDKDLICSSEPSLFKASSIKQNEKENTDISFENYYYDNQIYVDNLLKRKNILENNYLQKPIEHEKYQRMQIMKNSLYSQDGLEYKNYCNSCEDIYFPKNYKKSRKNKNKKIGKRRKNQAIKKLFDEDSLFNNEEDSNNNNVSDYYDQKKFDDDKEKNFDIKDIKDTDNSLFKEEKDFEGDEKYIFPDGILENDGENSLIDEHDNEIMNHNGKKGINKNKKKNRFYKNKGYKNNEEDKNNEDEKNFENDKESEEDEEDYHYNNGKNKNKRAKNENNINSKNNENNSIRNNFKKRFIKSIDKTNSFDKDSEERKDGKEENKNEKLKTEYDQNVKKKIKLKLKKIANDDDDPNSIGGIFNKNRKNTISNDSDYNNLLKSQNPKLLKLKSKKYFSKNSNMHNKNDSSKEIHSNRRMIKIKEEEIKEGDMAISISENNSKNDNISDIVNEEKISKYNKSDNEMFNKKNLASSISAFLDTEDSKPVLIEENFLLFYWKYIQKREICLVSFKDKNQNIPYFVRWSCFVFCLIFIFLLNCFFFFEKNVHKRYINSLKGNKNRLGYYFKNEYLHSVYVSLISIVFKIIIVKLVLFKLFKIKKKKKKMMCHFSEKGLDDIQFEELQKNRNRFLKKYKIKLIIYFVLMMTLSIIFAYICICYAGVFPNSISAFLLGFLFSFITSIIICSLLCFIIVGIYRIGKKCKNRCLLSTYIVFSTIY